MASQFTYSIATDTANAAVASGKLHNEIAVSSITISLTGVSVSGDVITIDFQTDISAGEETTLDSLVSAHDGIPGPDDPKPVYVPIDRPIHQYALAEGNYLRARLVGIHHAGTATKTTTTDFDWAIPQTAYIGVNKQSYMDGIQYRAKDAVDGDKMTFQVIDKDGVVYPAGTVLDEFGTDWPVVPDEKDVIRLYKAKLIPGFYIRIKYTSVGTVNDVKFSVGLFRHMDTAVDL